MISRVTLSIAEGINSIIFIMDGDGKMEVVAGMKS